MPSDEQPGDGDHRQDTVDFVVDPGAPPRGSALVAPGPGDGREVAPETMDEELEAAPPSGFLGFLRRRLDLGIAAVVLVGALLVAQAVTNGHRSPSPASTPSSRSSSPPVVTTPAPIVSSAPAVPMVSFGPPPLTAAHSATDDPKTCPRADDGLSLCESTREVPRAWVAAVHSYFPGLTARDGLTEELRDVGYGAGGLYYRELTETGDGTRLLVRVYRSRSDASDGLGLNSTTHGGRSTIEASTARDRYSVSVRYVVPGTKTPSTRLQDDLEDLVSDGRLLAGR